MVKSTPYDEDFVDPYHMPLVDSDNKVAQLCMVLQEDDHDGGVRGAESIRFTKGSPTKSPLQNQEDAKTRFS